ncbi:hypothetical protein WA026_017953 [Henosepilachna vigintioctopunctata]|uniref:Luciferin 4-monooxygenase n=1 Tax=Henosepilachna vigintioctopunctata TaxID=420089 RepID=A0AAW1TQ76_9CUCU
MLGNGPVIYGLDPLEPLPNISFGEIIYQTLKDKPKNQPILINGHSGKKITYSELLEKSCLLADALISYGYGPNTVMAISSKNSLEYYYPLIAAIFIGAVAAPLNNDYTNIELNHVLNIFKPRVIFCSKDLVQKFMKQKSEKEFIEKIIVIDTEESVFEGESLKHFIAGNVNGSMKLTVYRPVDIKAHPAFLMCSSGTTGLPKAVMLTHQNLNTLFMQFKDSRILGHDVISLCLPPFFHVYGLGSTLIGMLVSGPIVFLHHFEGNSFLKSIEEYKVNRLFLVPPLVVYLTKCPFLKNFDLSSITEVICGAAPLKESTERDIKEKLNLKVVRQVYGLTETSYAVMYSDKDGKKWKPGSSGRVGPYIQFAVRNPDTGKFLGPNESGEICIKGDMVMKGYYDNLEATENAFTDNGWLRTGDIGYYDEEEYFYITDRIKELIKYKGFQVAPAELEALLLTHEDIIDTGVIGVPDERAGELPFAFVVKKQNSLLCAKEVQSFVENNLSHQKWLRGGVIFVDSIPKTASGKILRKELRILFQKL